MFVTNETNTSCIGHMRLLKLVLVTFRTFRRTFSKFFPHKLDFYHVYEPRIIYMNFLNMLDEVF